MVGELGFLADYQTTENALQSNDATLIWEAITEDSIHINCIFLTSLQQLPAGIVANDDYSI